MADAWTRVDEILHSVLLRPLDERDRFLRDACAGDTALETEVRSLLAADEQARSFLEDPAIHAAARALAGDQRGSEARRTDPLATGRRLGDYTILGPIGAGGMGEVYRARDTRLSRDVAIKVLPLFVSGDAQRLRRFEQEARAAAALSHPNILAVFQMGSDEGAPYLVSELLDGSTLREQLQRGPLPLRKVIDYGVQIARGLAAAHEKGIVHRDLKPENLFVTKDGRVKILDFGLARLVEQPWRALDTNVPTEPDATEPGMVLGTVGYMSPEQVRGHSADHRADIFAFGAVLYEMLTGTRAFQKATSVETMTAILNEDPPDLSQLAPSASPALVRVAQRCLEKNPEQRFQSASDLAFALEALSASTGAPASAIRTVKARRVSTPLVPRTMAAAIVSLVVLAGGALWWSYRSRQPALPWLTGSSASMLTTSPGDEVNPAVSPDGAQVAFAWRGPDGGRQRIYVTGIDGQQEPRRLTGNAADDTADDFPAWSPDGQQIAFVRRYGATEAAIMIVPAQGGPEHLLRKIRMVAVANPHSWLSWRPDGTEVAFAAESGDSGRSTLFMLRIGGGHLRTLITPPEGVAGDASPAIAPDGRSLVFVRYLSPGASTLLVQRLDAHANAVGEPMPIPGAGEGARTAIWADEARLLFAENGRILEWHAGTTARPVYVSTAGLQGLAFAGRDRRGVARVIAAQRNAAPNHLWMIPLGTPGQATDRPALQSAFGSGIANPDFSPDGTHVVFKSTRSGTPEIWMADADGRNLRQLTWLGVENVGIPRWSPDGRSVAFFARLTDEPQIFVIDTTQERPMPQQRTHKVPGCNIPSWSRDGRFLYCSRRDGREVRLYRVPMDNSDPSDQGVERWFEGKDARETRDGRLIYLKDGVPGIFVRSLAGDPRTNPEEQLVSDIVGPIAYYALAPSGIYYRSQNNLTQYVGLRFFDLARHRTVDVASRAVTGETGGLTVSPDGRLLLYAQTTQPQTDLTLIRFQ
jgi:serine/threonine protein kinase/Tol biopolymer transport system component